MQNPGGQVGDQGVIKTSTGKINVLDTQKKMGDLHIHVGKVSNGINKSRREC
jgi:alanyl-tRNA synthetase